jgi:hypothetical protein
MKKCILLLLCVFLIKPVAGQIDQSQLYQNKIKNFTRMRNAGWAMAGVGGGFATAGGVLLISLPDGYWNDDYNNDQVDESGQDIGEVIQVLTGVVFLGVGVGLMAGGITMGSISSGKIKKYQGKLDNLSIGIICTPNKQGFSLVYRF